MQQYQTLDLLGVDFTMRKSIEVDRSAQLLEEAFLARQEPGKYSGYLRKILVL